MESPRTRVYFSVQLITICAVVNLKCAPEKATCAVVICASRLNFSTETRYLFIYHNLPPSATWNPRPAVLSRG